MKRLSKDPHIAAEVLRLIGEGWKVEYGKTHHKVRAPNGRVMIIPSTPSSPRSAANFKGHARRVGRLDHL